METDGASWKACTFLYFWFKASPTLPIYGGGGEVCVWGKYPNRGYLKH